MAKEYYYLYVYSVNMTGRHELITGKLFFDSETAIDKAKEFCSIPGYHAQVVTGTTVIYNQ